MRIPLLRDRHTHPFLYASWIDGLNVYDAHRKTDALDRIEKAEVADDEILVVQGWLDSKYQISPTELPEDKPVAVFNLSLHGLLMNAKAQAMVEAQLGMVGHWSEQSWFEHNLRKILNGFAVFNGNASRLKRYFQWLRSEHGDIYAEEMLLADEKEIDAFREAGLMDRTRFWCSQEMFRTLRPESQALIHGMKIFADGALGVRTAALNVPYIDGDHGMLMYSKTDLREELEGCIATGKAIAIHAIGDRAIDHVVYMIHLLRSREGFENEVRIEHAQLISLETARLAKDAGIVLSMQPNFSSDSVDYSDRLPKKYLRANNPFRMLIDEVGFVPGEDLIFGSDGMPPGANTAVQQALNPPFPAQQALTIEELVAGYCDSSIYECDETIEVGLP
jgi:predicted amidohydrolase YtcJ